MIDKEDSLVAETDYMHESCGIFGVYNHPDAAKLTYLGLYALQHRGQESSGIVASDTERLTRYAGMGLVNEVYRRHEVLDNLTGIHAIGHNRYSTSGSSTIANAQPILIDFKNGQIAAAHNGNLVNAFKLRCEMEDDGSIFTSTTDTEVIMHLIARSRHNTIEAMILDALSYIEGAYSLLFLTKGCLFAARDPLGIRPLLLGKKDETWYVSSETCAFDLVGAEMIREVKPGEMIRIRDGKVSSYQIQSMEKVPHLAQCIFEYIYFSRPDSYIFGNNVDKIRRRLGRQLAKEHPVPGAHFVMGVPDSATTAALGFSEESGIRFDIGLIRNHYVGRTFIQPAQKGRDFGVLVKFNTVKGVLKDKKVVIVDDSIVRGTTMKKIIRLIRSAGPAEIHLRISSPPIICPCFLGIDMPTKDELIASAQNVDEIKKYLEVDSLGYLSIEGLRSAMPEPREDYCCACFDGNYPVEPPATEQLIPKVR
jgi:amidophosphoribosyltransferase